MSTPTQLPKPTSTPKFTVTYLPTSPASPDTPANSIVHVEISRPQKLNAFSRAMFDELHEIFVRIAKDRDIRCVILTGAGERAFMAGLDLVDNMATLGGSGDGENGKGKGKGDVYRRARELRLSIERLQECLNVVEKCGKPVICLLHGISYGLALDLACCCDIRLCTTTTVFSLKEVDIGIAADLGTLTRLPHQVKSLSWVKEIAYTARDFTSSEALEQGFVSYVLKDKKEAWEKAVEIAKAIAEKSPVAVESTKELIEWGLGRPVADGLRYTQLWNSSAVLAGDVKEAVGARVQRRKARFEKL